MLLLAEKKIQQKQLDTMQTFILEESFGLKTSRKQYWDKN